MDHAGGDRHRHPGDPAGSDGHALARRRPVKVARETASLDRLSGGRRTLGVGLGDEQAGNEYSITGEELDERRHARMLDESLEILTAAWTGEPVHHRGEHCVVDGMRFLPRPVQRLGVPIWVAGRYGKAKPLRPAARFQGFFPVDLEHPDQLAEMIAELTALRREIGKDVTDPYDVVAALATGHGSGTIRIGGCDVVDGGVRVG